MRFVFADTHYWVAVLNPRDSFHEIAMDVSNSLGSAVIMTSEMVLAELLNYFAEKGEKLRAACIELVQRSRGNPNVKVIPQTQIQFGEALSLYAQRSDKEWSLTDCASFQIMEKGKCSEALTNDRHFEQAGFKILLKEQE